MPATIFDLNEKCLAAIFQKLRIRDLYNVGEASRTLKKVADEVFLQKYIELLTIQ